MLLRPPFRVAARLVVFSGVVAVSLVGVFHSSRAGSISTIAGTGAAGYNADAIPATQAQVSQPRAVALDTTGDIFIADTENHRVRKITIATGVITTIAGTGTAGYSGDGGPATAAQLSSPSGIRLNSSGDLFIGDSGNNRVRKVDGVTDFISTVAGTGLAGYNGDGISATSVQLNNPRGLGIDSSGNLYIADEKNNRVRRLDQGSGQITTVAGNGSQGYNGDGIVATTAHLFWPHAVVVDAAGNLLLADTGNSRVRKITVANGLISTLAGTGVAGYNGDWIAGKDAKLGGPHGLATDSSGNIFVADTYNNRVRKLDSASGHICTVAGEGTAGFNGENADANAAQLFFPYDVVLSAPGALDISDGKNNRLRRVNAPACHPRPVESAKKGSLLIAPNVLDVSDAANSVAFVVKGEAGAETRIQVHDAAGNHMGSFLVQLDEEGEGTARYPAAGLDGLAPGPGSYWVQASGGGVEDTRLFFVVFGRTR